MKNMNKYPAIPSPNISLIMLPGYGSVYGPSPKSKANLQYIAPINAPVNWPDKYVTNFSYGKVFEPLSWFLA